MLAVYLACPFTAPTLEGREENRRRAAKWAAWLWRQGFAVECSWLILTGELEETPENRELGLRSDCEQVKRCDVMVLCGPRISGGMLREAGAAKVLIDFTHLMMDMPDEKIRWRHGRPITLAEAEAIVGYFQKHAAKGDPAPPTLAAE